MSFISPAFAQAAPATGTGDLIQGMLPFVLIFVVFYFLLIRPQQKKMNQHKAMLAAIRRGDRVVTGGGIVGLVTRVVSDQELLVEIADNVRIRVMRDTVASVLAKTEPAAAGGGKGKDDDKDDGAATGDGDAKGGAAPEGGDQGGTVSGLKKLLLGKR